MDTSSFSALPAEIRYSVLHCHLERLLITAKLGHNVRYPRRKAGLRERFRIFCCEDDQWQFGRPPPPLYVCRRPDLLYVSKQMALDMRIIQWQSLVTWDFPSTLAMVDVLLGLSTDDIQLLRNIRVANTPVPLCPVESPHNHRTYGVRDMWRLVDGVAVDVLELENAYLEKGNVSYSRKAVIFYLKSLIRLYGWRELRLLSWQPYLTNNEIRQLIHEAEIIRQERNEPGFEVDFPMLPVERDPNTGHIVGLTDDAVQEVSRASGLTPYFVIKRGAGTDVRQEREMATPQLRRLFEHMTWKEIRESGDYLDGERLDDMIGMTERGTLLYS